MNESTRLMFTRPLALAIGFSVILELFNFIVFAMLPSGSGHLLSQFIWMVGIGGIGMGAILGVFLDVILVGRINGKDAIYSTVLLTFISHGVIAKLITLNMTSITSGYILTQWPVTYFLVGSTLAAAAGALLGWLLFTDKGNEKLSEYGF